MKKFKIAALLMCFVAVSMVFTSCSKNEDLIIGKWKVTKVTEGDRVYTEGEEIGSIWEFKSDNTFTLSFEYAGQSMSVPGTYAINDDELTITMYGEAETATIDKLNKSKMILSSVDEGVKIVEEFEKQ